MRFAVPKNENYTATIVKITNIVPLVNCDNITSSMIFGYPVIISKDTTTGTVGVYFPPETQLSEKFCKVNNLYRDKIKNDDVTRAGYIEDSRRIRTVKFRGNQSVGLFMPLESLSAFCNIENLAIGDVFDEIRGESICNKYVVAAPINNGTKVPKTKKVKSSKLVGNQFKFHVSTSNLAKSVHVFNMTDTISITKKMHGTSGVFSKVLCKKSLGWIERLLKWSGVNIVDTVYDNVYSSRTVIKNDDMNTDKVHSHFYDSDIWGLANNIIKEVLLDGISVYGEIVGYIPSGTPIQSIKGKCYDYGCNPGKFETYVYRVTYTNTTGNVFEFSMKQVHEFCEANGLKAVPLLYQGTPIDFLKERGKYDPTVYTDIETLRETFVEALKAEYLEKDCNMCENTLPDEGIVVRREISYIDAYKLKSFRFLNAETEELDKGNSNIEDAQGSEDIVEETCV